MFTMKRRFFSYGIETNANFFKKIFLRFYVPCCKNGQIVVECYQKIHDVESLYICNGNKTYVAFVMDGRSGSALYVSAIKLLEGATGQTSLLYSLRSTIAIRIASQSRRCAKDRETGSWETSLDGTRFPRSPRFRDKSFPSPIREFYRGRLSRIAVRATNITINWTRRERIMPRRIYAGPTFSLFHLILEPCTTIVSTRRGRAREPRRYQGNRMAAINLVRYNRTKKMRFTFITAISLALMTFTAHVYHITYLPYNPCIIFFVINCRLRFPSPISIN